MYFIRRSVRKLRGKYTFFFFYYFIQSVWLEWETQRVAFAIFFSSILSSYVLCYTERREYLSKERFIYLLEAHFQHKKLPISICISHKWYEKDEKKGKNVKWCGEKKKIFFFVVPPLPPFLLAMGSKLEDEDIRVSVYYINKFSLRRAFSFHQHHIFYFSFPTFTLL